MTRSVFTVKREDATDMFGDDEYVRYGQKVRIASSDYLFRKAL